MNTMRNTLFTILLSILFFTPQDIIAKPFIFRNISTKEGLCDQIVTAIHKDKMGLIWIGSASCVECFDGTNIKHFKVPGENSVRRRVTALLTTNAPKLWMGNGDGLWYLDGEKEKFVRYDVSKIPFGVYALEEREDVLYISTVRGLYSIKGDEVKRTLINQNELAPSNILYGMSFEDSDCLWIASEGGINCINLETEEIKTYTSEECSSFCCVEYING